MYVFDNELKQSLLQILFFEIFYIFKVICTPHDMFNNQQNGKYTSIFFKLVLWVFLRL